MKTVVNVHDLKTNYSRYLEQAIKGEEIILGKHGKPVAKIVPLPDTQLRTPGILAGKAWIDDDFDEPMPELIAAMEEDIDANSA